MAVSFERVVFRLSVLMCREDKEAKGFLGLEIRLAIASTPFVAMCCEATSKQGTASKRCAIRSATVTADYSLGSSNFISTS